MDREPGTAPAPEPGADWISDLPLDLIGTILSNLSLKETIQTSILSRSWRDRWRSALRHLKVDQDAISPHHERFLEIVDGVFRAVTGPINSFELFTRTVTNKIPRWIHHAVTHGTTTFRLTVEEDFDGLTFPKLGQLPDSLLSFRGLKSLNLSSFEVRPPPGFKGFEQLTSFGLYNCVCSPEGELGRLIANSPSLTQLVLCQVNGWKDIEIFSPSLRFLLIASYGVNTVSLKKCPNLEAFYINIYDGEDGEDGARSRSVADIFNGPCGQLQDFTLRNGFSYGHTPDKLPQRLESLRCLTLSGNLRLRRNRVVAWCILRSSPALENLKVLPLEEDEGEMAMGTSTMGVLEAGDGLLCKLNQLRSAIVHWSSLRNASHEDHLEFWKDILANTPALEHFTIHIDNTEQKIEAEEFLLELSMQLKASKCLKFKVKCEPMQRCGFIFGE